MGGMYQCNEFRHYSVSTDNSCQAFMVGISLNKMSSGLTVQPIKIRLVGYVNGKEIRSKDIDITGDAMLTTLSFGSQISGEDMIVTSNY